MKKGQFANFAGVVFTVAAAVAPFVPDAAVAPNSSAYPLSSIARESPIIGVANFLDLDTKEENDAVFVSRCFDLIDSLMVWP